MRERTVVMLHPPQREVVRVRPLGEVCDDRALDLDVRRPLSFHPAADISTVAFANNP
eukprot:COSAG05_NODE_3490_length_2029_cov_2.334715_3_plen_57_part_00